MAKIIQLDAHVANLIAAGEVVERPASVVKELMENAIDAGARALTVEIQNGGMRLIRLTDNGSGIPPEEAETAFLRHATSKLRSARDLEAIVTLGFRGEALAAIAAVSRIELLTRTEDAPLGISLLLEGGTLRLREESGCQQGTTLLVRDLFFNTPARLKFMKRDAAEGAAVFSIVQKVALAHPELSIKFLRDGKQELFTPGDGKLSSVLYSVFGRDLALGFTELRAEGEDMTVAGFISLPACCRGTRGYQHFILNGRPIRSPLLMAAVEEAYKNQKMVGKFPACVLHLSVRPSSVDVNVHPAKTEVKFVSERKVFDAVYYAVLSALDAEGRHPVLEMEKPKRATAPTTLPNTPTAGGFQSMTAQQLRDGAPALSVRAAPSLTMQAVMGQTAFTLPKAEPRMPLSIPQREAEAEAKSQEEGPSRQTAPLPSVVATPPEAELPTEVSEERPWRIAGEVLDTYIIVEQGDDTHFIDKHAAHERMHFDRMQKEDYVPMAQSLLESIILTLPPEERNALLAQLPLLEDFGFSIEAFGGDALILRQLPAELLPTQAEEILSELAEAFSKGARAKLGLREQILHSVACKAAIKGGRKSAPEELLQVAEAVMSGAVKYCPHGRPVAVTLSRAQLERRFGRA